MDCPDAQMTMSAEFDGETVPQETSDEAAAHCASCSECAEFRGALEALAAMPTPTPPADLADRAVAAVARVAQETAVAATVPVPVKPAPRRNTWLWVGSAAALVAAALIVFAVVRLAGVPSAATEARSDALATSGSAASGTAAPSVASPSPIATTAPPYVTFNDFVYVVGDTISVSTSQLTTAGTVVSSMRTVDTPATLQTFRLVGQPRVLVVLNADGSYVRCTAVVRNFQGTTYQLVAGTTIQNFGTWPVLPPTVSQPMSADGSPALTSAGTDDLGVPVFRLLGSSAQQGIAVGPGTPAGDPAASNPDWTWWLPAPS
jgi:hypothetical protein